LTLTHQSGSFFRHGTGNPAVVIPFLASSRPTKLTPTAPGALRSARTTNGRDGLAGDRRLRPGPPLLPLPRFLSPLGLNPFGCNLHMDHAIPIPSYWCRFIRSNFPSTASRLTDASVLGRVAYLQFKCQISLKVLVAAVLLIPVGLGCPPFACLMYVCLACTSYHRDDCLALYVLPH
jgi:hypothetical protein